MDRYLKISKGNTEMTVDRVGAQIVSYKVGGLEIMYQGAMNPDNSKWKATAKNLFPNPGPVGKSNDKWGELQNVEYDVNGKVEKHTVYVHNGGLYHMGQHGFAQSKEFDVHGVNKNSCVLSISADRQQTYTEYPYNYTYYVALEIPEEGQLDYMTVAQNNDIKPMLAGMGWHPAFKLHDNAQKYKIRFENLSKTDDCGIVEGEFYDIYDNVIAQNASVKFMGIKSANVVLYYEKENGEYIPYLSMHTEEPNIILWSRNRDDDSQEEFICIEPWNTTPRQINKLTTQDKTAGLANEGAVIVNPSEQSELKAKVTINPEYVKIFAQEQSHSHDGEPVR